MHLFFRHAINFVDAISIIETIEYESQFDAPVILAEKYRIIDKDQMNKILEYEKEHRENLGLADNLSVKKDKILIDLGNKLSRDINYNPTHKNYFWLISAIAKTVEKYINENDEQLKFSEFCCLLLNSTTVQMTTKLKNTNKNSVQFEQFETVWPDNSVTKVVLSAKKRYLSTGIRGKFTFIIKYEKKQEKQTT